MYIVNTSFFVDTRIAGEWLGAIKTGLLPLLRKAGFGGVTFSRILSQGQADGETYSLLFEVGDMGAYTRFMEEILEPHKEESLSRFGQQVLWVTSVMKIVEKHV